MSSAITTGDIMVFEEPHIEERVIYGKPSCFADYVVIKRERRTVQQWSKYEL